MRITWKRTLWMGLLIFTGGVWAQAPGTVTKLYTFKGMPDGANPEAGLVADSNGVLYGTTANGGLPASDEWWVTDGCGTVFSLTPPASPSAGWTETILYRFTGGSDGCGPSGLVIGSDGVLYGTTSNGEADGAVGLPLGTVFSLTPPAAAGGAWTETVLHTFYGCPDDAAPPLFSLALGETGVLYGAGFYGGNMSCLPSDNAAGEGAVFALTPPASAGGAWTESMVYSIGDLDDGPATNVTLGRGGVLYGTTVYGGGAYGGPGTVYSLAPPSAPGGSWTQTVLSNFTTSDGKNNGSRPGSPMAIGPGGVLYGTTSGGGVGGGGEVYSLTPPESPGGTWTYTVLRDFSSTKGNPIGSSPQQLTLVPGTPAPGAIFTTCAHGGAARAGTVIALTPPATPGEPWTQKIVHTFDGADGIWPNGGLLIGNDGLMYGTTFGRQPGEAGGGPRYGTVYSLQP